MLKLCDNSWLDAFWLTKFFDEMLVQIFESVDISTVINIRFSLKDSNHIIFSYYSKNI